MHSLSALPDFCLSGYLAEVQIALDIAKALVYLHSRRIVHLDIKSANVLLQRWGGVRWLSGLQLGVYVLLALCMHEREHSFALASPHHSHNLFVRPHPPGYPSHPACLLGTELPSWGT